MSFGGVEDAMRTRVLEVYMGEVLGIVSDFNSQGCFAKGERKGVPCLRTECFGVWQ